MKKDSPRVARASQPWADSHYPVGVNLPAQTQGLAAIYQRKLAALEALKKSLLHQAFTGQLRWMHVSQSQPDYPLPTDTPGCRKVPPVPSLDKYTLCRAQAVSETSCPEIPDSSLRGLARMTTNNRPRQHKNNLNTQF